MICETFNFGRPWIHTTSLPILERACNTLEKVDLWSTKKKQSVRESDYSLSRGIARQRYEAVAAQAELIRLAVRNNLVMHSGACNRRAWLAPHSRMAADSRL